MDFSRGISNIKPLFATGILGVGLDPNNFNPCISFGAQLFERSPAHLLEFISSSFSPKKNEVEVWVADESGTLPSDFDPRKRQ